MDLSGKIAVVTGASSGIGESTAEHLAKEGATVVLVARRKDRLEKLAKKIKDAKGKADIIEADIMGKAACNNVVEQVIKEHGRLDILVNNAGVMLLGPIDGAPLEEWDNMIRLNVMSLMYMTHAALPHMKKNKFGHIVNISSVAGRVAASGSGVYNASKFGVNAFSESLRQELAQQKSPIRVTMIEPGAVATELVSHNRDEVKDVIQKRIGNIDKRLEADDIARAIAYVTTQPSHVNVNEVLIRPVTQA